MKFLEGWPERARELYAEFERQRRQKSRHSRDYLRNLGRFLAFQAERGLLFREFPPSLINAYLEKFTPKQQRTQLGILRPWMRFLYRRRELLSPLHEDYSGAHLPLYGRRPPLTHEQILQVFHLVPLDTSRGLRDRAFLEMAYGTAMRRAELINLDLADVELGEGWVFLRNTKNNRQRKVPLTYWASHYLRRYLEEARPLQTSPLSSTALWLNRFGQRLALSGLRQSLHRGHRIQDHLDFPFTLHQLRHSAATHMLTAGASLRAVQELLGHGDIASTGHYTHLNPYDLKEMHERFHPRNQAIGAGFFQDVTEP